MNRSKALIYMFLILGYSGFSQLPVVPFEPSFREGTMVNYNFNYGNTVIINQQNQGIGTTWGYPEIQRALPQRYIPEPTYTEFRIDTYSIYQVGDGFGIKVNTGVDETNKVQENR